MGNAVKLDDIGTEHDGFPPTPVDWVRVLIGGGTVTIG